MHRVWLWVVAIVMPVWVQTASARPVSYPGGWTLITHHDSQQNSALVHYSPNAKNAFGARIRYDREQDFTFVGGQWNHLVKRWNKTDSQANIYARAGVGTALDDGNGRESDAALFLGVSGDWETRRYFISGAAEYWDTGRFGDFTNYHGRIGFAPYVAGTGALHTWFMLEGQNRPENIDTTRVTALVRFFKGPHLLEVGIDDDGDPLFHYTHRF